MISEALDLCMKGGQVCACVLLVMAMVGWVVAEMDVVDGVHAGQIQRLVPSVRRCTDDT